MVLALLLSACATLPTEPAPRADALPRELAGSTALGSRVLSATTAHGSDSGIRLLDTGRDAFLERAALIEAAERSIDAQYYIWNSDATGRYMAARLYAAAGRGVRVRVLLDDINVGARDDVLALLDQHPNIEIRIYNPALQRRGLRWALGFLREFSRLNRRMHNKSFTVDGSVTIIGGRNIGDEYFDAHATLNFRDRDVVAVGPVVTDTAQMFDAFWNSVLARPVTEFGNGVRAGDLQSRARRVADDSARLAQLYGALPQDGVAGLGHVSGSIDAMRWAPARLVHDGPPSGAALADTTVTQTSAAALGALASASREEILIESAYLVLDQQSVDAIRAMHARGMRLRALTNSLASNDVTANHGAYARRRDAILASGVELYEMRPDAASCRGLVLNGSACGSEHVFGLHAKTFVFDRRTVYVGSLNLNLRSRFLNAESGLVIESPELAAQVAADIELNMAPANSWRVVADPRGRAQWLEGEGSEAVTLNREPRASWSRRASAAMISLLPLEKYL
ncbi:MAG: phospholipase D family protein [Pseudomonadales bacterium]|jgi:putative cardiolipin synthase|nr:phospholipase D family protein [Pseudomonadales bacterium]MBP9032910.1 phospholipase D family protein [Pseudomonadales bacterium]